MQHDQTFSAHIAQHRGRPEVRDYTIRPDQSTELRMMTYSHDGYGLGHLRRNCTIATSLVKEMPHSTVLMLVGCPVGAFFELPPRVDFVKVPSIIKVAAGEYKPLGLGVSWEQTKALRSSIIATTAEMFQPDVFLVDHVPTGVWGELLPTLRMLKDRGNQTTIILGIRDIIDSPEVVREQWHREDNYKTINAYYDEVFIYGSKDVFDAAFEYGLYGELRTTIRYCGYVGSDQRHKPKGEMRHDLGIEKDKLVVVTAGGGHDGFPMMQACMDAFRLLGKDAPFEAIFVAGPLMEYCHKKSLRRQAGGLNIRVLNHVHESLSYLEAADLVITMAGYNSICEVLKLKKKALVIPREGPRAEQRMRARVLRERDLADVLYTRELSPEKLAARIVANLEQTDCPYQAKQASVDTSGARCVAGLLAALWATKANGAVARCSA
jgi:predicted glycosyltransferase